MRSRTSTTAWGPSVLAGHDSVLYGVAQRSIRCTSSFCGPLRDRTDPLHVLVRDQPHARKSPGQLFETDFGRDDLEWMRPRGRAGLCRSRRDVARQLSRRGSANALEYAREMRLGAGRGVIQLSIFRKVSPGSSDDWSLESQPHLNHSPAGETTPPGLGGFCRRCGDDECFNGGGGNEPPSPDWHAGQFSVSQQMIDGVPRDAAQRLSSLLDRVEILRVHGELPRSGETDPGGNLAEDVG